MKKPVIALVAVLVVVDAAALFFYLKHKDRKEAPPAAAAPLEAAAPQEAGHPSAAHAPAPSDEPAPTPAPSGPAAASAAENPYGGPGMYVTPGNCKSTEECARYCSDPAHKAECREFLGEPEPEPDRPAPPKLAEPAMGEKGGAPLGPGGCRSAEECQRYCSIASNAAECRASAQKDRTRVIALVRAGSPTSRACVVQAVGKPAYDRFMSGKENISPKFSAAMKRCFQTAPDGTFGHRPDGKKRSAGPGGCSSGEACMAYCSQAENAEECLAWKDLPPQFRPMLQKLVGGDGGDGGGEGDDGAGE